MLRFPKGYEEGVRFGDWAGGLPIGVKEGGKRVRDFAVCETTLGIEDLITNKKLMKEYPQTWTARLCCMFLERLGTHQPRAELLKDKSHAKLPDIIRQIPVQDVAFILLKGHIDTFGYVVEDVQQQCPSCGKAQYFDLDLRDSLILNHDKDTEGVIKCELEKGWEYDVVSSKTDGVVPADKGKVINYLEFRYPTVGDVLMLEKHYEPSKLMTFEHRIANLCLTRLESREDMNVQGEELTTEGRGLMGRDKLGVFGGRDRAIIRRVLNEVPKVWVEQVVECPSCSERFFVDPTAEMLFPL